MLLEPANDPMGQALMDFQQKQKAKKLWVLSDIAEDDEIPVSYLFRNFKQMPLIEQKALQLSNGKILDVGAASGSHSLWLQNQQQKVWAMDISRLATEVMQKRGVAQILLADFFEFKPESKFDTLLFLMNGIGIAGTLENVPSFLNQCKNLINPGGQVLLDSSDIIYLFGDEENGYEIDLNASYYGEINYQMKYHKTIGNPFPWLFIDFDTLKMEAENAGFICEKLADGPHFDYLAKLTIK